VSKETYYSVKRDLVLQCEIPRDLEIAGKEPACDTRWCERKQVWRSIYIYIYIYIYILSKKDINEQGQNSLRFVFWNFSALKCWWSKNKKYKTLPTHCLCVLWQKEREGMRGGGGGRERERDRVSIRERRGGVGRGRERDPGRKLQGLVRTPKILSFYYNGMRRFKFLIKLSLSLSLSLSHARTHTHTHTHTPEVRSWDIYIHMYTHTHMYTYTHTHTHTHTHRPLAFLT